MARGDGHERDATDGRRGAPDGRRDATDGRFDAPNGRRDTVDGRFDAADGRRDTVDEWNDRASSRDAREDEPVTPPGSLLVVSNRQPYRHEYEDADAAGGRPDRASISVDEPTGGLTAGLDPVLRRTNGTWIAWGDGDADRAVTDANDCVAVPPDEESYTLRRVWLSDTAVDAYYYGFSNRVLWPLCHGLPGLVSYRPAYFQWYRRVNARFAEAVAEHAGDDSVIWIQDYHFALAPRSIRDRVPADVPVAQFWHIPWPRPDTFELCPNREELLEGLLGNDMLCFHVEPYADRFIDSVDRFLPDASVDRRRNVVEYDGETTWVPSAAMGIDARAQERLARSADAGCWSSLRADLDVPEDVVVGLGVDRLDYTKGIPHRLAAVERFFERNPDWHGRFTFVQKATPSRTDIPAYERLGERVRAQVERINDRFGTADWRPVAYTEAHLSQEELAALYRYADLLVVSSIADGMNLVAQEYVAANVDETGALVLSERAGVHERLGSHAFSIDPESIADTTRAIERALAESPSERRGRMRTLRQRVFDADLKWWMRTQFDRMGRLRDDPVEPGERREGRSFPV